MQQKHFVLRSILTQNILYYCHYKNSMTENVYFTVFHLCIKNAHENSIP